MDNHHEQVSLYIGPGGKMEQEIPGFRFRQEQMNLALQVVQSFDDDSFVVAEVGTGVGKTFAYLIPAILWATREKKKIVVSTRTKALQQQIINRDLPDLARVMNIKFNYAEAKGRDNFLCWNKYMNILAGKRKLEAGEDSLVQAVLNWAESTPGGDRKELTLNNDLMQHWHVLAADRNNCERDMCKYHDKCFRLKMMRRLEKADIIIANHALLLSDILVERSIIPPYEHLVIDEAHTFIKESFDRLSNRFSCSQTLDLLHILYSKEKRVKKGYLLYLQGRYAQLSPVLTEVRMLTDRAITLTPDFFKCLSTGMKYGDDYNYHHIITEGDMNRPWYEYAVDIYMDWQSNYNLLLSKLRDIKKELEGEDDESELEGIINSLGEISGIAFEIMEESLPREDKICWVEYDKGKAVALCSADIYTGDIVNQRLYQDLKGLVMVSATLAVEQNFNNFINRSGLMQYAKEGRLDTLLENSPFNYQQQAGLYIVQDMPDPGSVRFSLEVNQVLEDILNHTGGSTMVLFTARKQLQEASAYLRQKLYNKNLKLLVQHEDGEFGALMDQFISSNNAVLMGLETFWEGIDLKGDCLKCLVIVKLPFRSPSDPYCSAWDRYYQTQRKSSFEHFMLPDAVVRFKQGVGRLIRSESDRGAVVVLDTRLIKKNYGRVLLNSIPIKNVTPVGRKELKRELEQWL